MSRVKITSGRTFGAGDRKEIAEAVREASGVTAVDGGPTDEQLADAVIGFIEKFEFWYTRVMQAAVLRYRNLVIQRINPFIRRIECDGLDARTTAARLIADYNARNSVTAGGWALEAMAVRIGQVRKSSSEGLDMERIDPDTNDIHLYMLKSGRVTRNSDILKALKRNAASAEARLRQDKAKTHVVKNYAIAAGRTSSTFKDGIRRPSSAEFWSEMTGLAEPEAIEVALAVAGEAGRLIKATVAEHLAALETLVADYIAERDDADVVDWEFLAKRNMQDPKKWREEDKHRHQRALEKLKASGYKLEPLSERKRHRQEALKAVIAAERKKK